LSLWQDEEEEEDEEDEEDDDEKLEEAPYSKVAKSEFQFENPSTPLFRR
jgi:hypothetical protein